MNILNRVSVLAILTVAQTSASSFEPRSAERHNSTNTVNDEGNKLVLKYWKQILFYHHHHRHVCIIQHASFSGPIPTVTEEVVFITAKFWYVSDFHGNNYIQYFSGGGRWNDTIPEKIKKSWKKDTSYKRAQSIAKKYVRYMNLALKNSKIPIRYMQWGSVQDIDKTEQEIGTGCQYPAPVCDKKKIKLRTTKEILDK